MISALDHVVVLVGDIKAGASAYQTLLARAPAWRNAGDGANRVLFTLDNITVELMEMPRLRSSSIQSLVADRWFLRAVTDPANCTAPP